MKNRFLFLVLCCYLTAFSPAYAAFPVKRATVSTTVTSSYEPGVNIIEKATEFRTTKKLPFLQRLLHFLPIETHNAANKPGWPGIVSLVCGILGIYFPLAIILGPCALVFGIVGLNNKYKNKGMALAGVILGGIEILFWILLIALFATLFAL